MKQLPNDFVEKYSTLLGKESADFFASFQEKPVSAFRVNPLKEVCPTYPDKIENLTWSYYGKVSGKSPEHVTGVVYSQEPAAQIVGEIACPNKGMRVLDLAAAPGGKTTHLLSYLENTGLLISNEISRKRSKILSENIERFGARNVVVTNESPERLAKVFPHFFDMIVLDAPCSGEGMFRKDPEAMEYWSTEYPISCAELQKEILSVTMTMLAPNGQLVYSTCTWSPEENEEVVQWLLERYPMTLSTLPPINGSDTGIQMPEVMRMYPHHFKGEGQFIAKMYSNVEETEKTPMKMARTRISKEQWKLWKEFESVYLEKELKGIFQVFGEELYLLPEGTPDLTTLRIARNGLHLGTLKKKRFEPSFALGLSLHSCEVKHRVELSEEEFRKYMVGHTLSVSQSYPNGWYQVAVNGNGLTFAKIVQGTLKNTIPKGLRFKG